MRILLLISFLVFIQEVRSQISDSTLLNIEDFPKGMLEKANAKTSKLSSQITGQTEKYLNKIQRQEEKLIIKLSKIDSNAAKQLLQSMTGKYSGLISKMKNASDNLSGSRGSEYIPFLDSLGGGLGFLREAKEVAGKTKEIQEKLSVSLDKVKELQAKFNQAAEIKKYLEERKEELKAVLSKYTNLPKSLLKNYQNLGKEYYYYAQQIREYKELLKDPDKMAQRAFALLNKVPAYRSFIEKNSFLASLFPNPDNLGTGVALQGLQTRAQIQGGIQSQLQSGGPSAQQGFHDQMQLAQSQLGQLKDKLSKIGGGEGTSLDVPDFKPNSQRTKSFLQRLELGTNIQTQRATSFFPTTIDLALSLGYKLNDRSIFGIGGSYKIGLGTGINHMHYSNQGVGLRIFVDWKIKGTFYASGGYEMNYRSQVKSFDQIKNLDIWQQSGLIGVSKRYEITKKWKGDLKLLFDFLYAQHLPRTQPVLFRVGYHF